MPGELPPKTDLPLDHDGDHVGHHDDGHVTTSPVGGFEAGRSPYGALNMAGNVSEWVHDWYAADYGGGDTDPKGPRTGPAKVVRGGAFGHARKADLEVTHRHVFDSRYQSMYIGFRCVR